MATYYPHLAVLALSALVTWVLVGVAASAADRFGWPTARNRDWTLRVLAGVVGALAGAALGDASPAVGALPWGTLVGLVGGGGSTTWVALGRRAIEARIDAAAGLAALPLGHDDGRHDAGGAP